MSTLLVGDILGCQLNTWQNKNENDTFTFIVDEFAEYSWLSTVIDSQLPLKMSEADNIVIALGFNDCVYSCLWRSFNINKIASDYTNCINNLITDYSQTTFYVCSVCPIDSQYVYNDIIINIETLNNKIKQFNDHIKNNCTATFIDCYEYLNSTSFSTRDGYHYQSGTIENIYYLISNSLNQDTSSSFTPRLEAPYPNSNDIESDMYWVNTSYSEGLNPFPKPDLYTKSAGDTLPNCTAYAWGRFYEITQERPKIFTGNAETWYGASRTLVSNLDTMAKNGTNYDGYKRGKEPALGAIICWEGIGPEAGHVAIVEQINDDGSILISESGYNCKFYWRTKTIQKSKDGSYNYGSSYKFQGFIYCPKITASPSAVDVNKADVVVKKGGLTQSEMEINAKYIWNYLGSLEEGKWTLNAVAGILGNMQHESSINPGRHESAGSGFGLVQWTPKSKFTNWATPLGYAEDDIDGQLERIIYEKNNGVQYSKNHYSYTFKEFAKSEDDPYTLACAFAWEYERSGVTLWGFHSKNNTAVYCRYSKGSNDCKNKCVGCRDCYKNTWGEEQMKKQAEKNKQALRDVRGGSAKKWFDFLLPLAPGVSKRTFKIFNFKLDNISTTSLRASFVVDLGEKYICKLINKSTGKSEQKIKCNISETDEIQTINISFNNLIPNSSYKLELLTTGQDGTESSLELNTTTHQSYPISVDNINLEYLKEKEIFNLSFNETQNWGYWKKLGYGYDIALIINGKIIDVKEKTSAYNDTINIVEYFKKYKPLLTDNIQIGVCPWTLYNNKKLYAQEGYKTSKSICLLKQNIVAYLN